MKAQYIGDFDEWKIGFRFSVPVTVRFSETDMYGHLNNTVNFAYFEYARIEFLKHIGLMNDWLSPDGQNIPVVADLQCDYLKQVFFDQSIDIHVKAEKIGSSSVDLHYLATDEKGEPLFTGRGTMVQISRRTGKGSPWTDGDREAFVAVPAAHQGEHR
ncbi:acyl-CoA thioesterase [Edaphobacillus lindanitolerans]|uniref:Acyl-CoA thioester hydrolase n=1 Tax=Edaphobacillus lindanitolerans TaxID=550447 RepID=A0A1U7PPU9_9BACI|nr:thioesterase family protein [Edaphobacillus lindanitolerans]SIT83535.1 acyl-CoA thioester hydrolase [Edaphobacillus lindanitolerans]